MSEAKAYYEGDADLDALKGMTMGIIGYGNQGRAQALNLRDSGVAVVVGNIRDASFEQAQSDGFPVHDIPEAVDRSDVVFLLVPDEAQQELYDEVIRARARAGLTLNFSHGYNITYGLIEPPANVDVIMVAPRMIGVGVREKYLEGSGAPAFVAVEQDASGKAWRTTLAIAQAIGATKAGALETTFKEETELDHFMEQAVWPGLSRLLIMAFEFLTEKGYQAEAVLMELYASGEFAEIAHQMAEVGLFRQMALHSRTSQYGTLSRGRRVLPDDFKAKFEEALGEIRSGAFAKEWEAERAAGSPQFDELRDQALAHPINEAEDRLFAKLRERT